MAKSSRVKGACGEREAAAFVSQWWPDAKRGLGQARSGGDVPDVDGTPLWLEVKRRKRIAFVDWLRQAERATCGRPPVVLLREDGDTRWVAMMDAQALLALLHAAGQ